MDFNQEQLAAIQSDARNLLVLAGAGTGKTRTIIGRAKWLVSQGVTPERIAIVTFTRRAANEIRSRLRQSAGTEAAKSSTGTFHHLCLRIMSARRQWFGFENLTVMDRDDQTHLMRLVRGELVGKNAIVPQAAQLISYYSYARNTNQPAIDYLRKFSELDESTQQTVLKIFAAYRMRKQSRAYMDYDDILHRFAKVLHDDATVRKRVCSRYDHVLVDEMQDTNPLQWLILQSFAEYCHLFCVGDDAQSIYAFRGADFRNVHSFDERLENSQTLKLEQNYRSTQPILDVANWLLAQSPLGYEKHLRAARGDGVCPQLLDFDSDLEEAEWIAETIKQRRLEGAAWSEHMILCRTAYSARPIEAELIREKIPYRFIGGMGLLQMAHVRDLLSVLRILVNYRDELAWVRYLTLWPKIGEVTAARIVERLAASETAEAAMQELAQALSKRPEIVELPAKLQALGDQPAAAIQLARELLEPILERKYDQWDQRKRDLVLLERLAENHRSISGFLETYTLDPISATEVDNDNQPDEGIVTLITVHSAKGTECEVCFVPAAQPGNYPHTRSLSDPDAIEEERRVLYVALTRAKDELYISRHLSRGYGRTSWNAAAGAHYFLGSLPAKLVQTKSRFAATQDWWDDGVIG
ncbi:MAG: ATP-dependent helicase [bacterium]|nr:ATP-dependent helicase [bacterium]